MGKKSRKKRERAEERTAPGAAAPGEGSPSAGPALRIGLPLAVALLSFLPFLPAATTNGFVDWDDEVNFVWNTKYRGLGYENLVWMWTDYKGHYMPFTWMTLGMDYVLWGMDARGYHLTSMVLHSVNAVLFYLVVLGLLHRVAASSGAPARGDLLRWAAAAAALLFAVHPLRVESVAWATERRDVLSGMFFLLAVLAYLRMKREPEDSGTWAIDLVLPCLGALFLSAAMAFGWWTGILPALLFMLATVAAGFLFLPGRRAGWMALTVLLFGCSLLSKAMGMALPLVLLAIDFFPLRALNARAILEKAPLVLLMIAAILMTDLTQEKAEALYKPGQYKAADMLTQPGYRVCFYMVKTLVPVNLSPLYLFRPYGDDHTEPAWVFGLAGLAAVGITVLVLVYWKRWPAGLATWFSYGVLLGPVIGLIQAGPHFAADRYTYLACMPFAVLAGGGALWLLRRVDGRALAAAGLAGVAVLGALSWRQTTVWRDTWSLWDHAMKIDDKMFIAYSSRGRARIDLAIDSDKNNDRGTIEDAIRDFNDGIALYPNYAEAYTNRGIAHHYLGKFDEAIADHTRAIELKKKTGEKIYAQAYNNRGVGYAARNRPGDLEKALADYTTAIETDARYVAAYTNRTSVLSALGRHEQAVEDCDTAIRIDPGNPEAYSNRGIALMALQRWDEAFRDFNTAIRLRPGYADPYSNRAIIKVKLRDFDGAIADFRAALEHGGPMWPHRARVEQMYRNAVRDKKRATGGDPR